MPVFLLGLLLAIQSGVALPPVHAADLTKDDLKTIAATTAVHYGLNTKNFLAVVQCESKWNPNAIGDHGTSFGLVQLHNPEIDWGITREQAQDPALALEIMAKAWHRGEARRWSCYSQQNPI